MDYLITISLGSPGISFTMLADSGVIFWWLAAGVAALIGVYAAVRLILKKKEHLPVMSPDEVNAFILTLGGKDNIKQVKIDGNRLRFELVSLKHCDYEGLKKLGAAGIFVSGNQVKLMLKDQAQALKAGIDAIKGSDES